MDLQKAKFSKAVNITTRVKEQNTDLQTAISALKSLRTMPRFEATLNNKTIGLTAEKEAKLREIIDFLEGIKISEYETVEFITNLLTKQSE